MKNYFIDVTRERGDMQALVEDMRSAIGSRGDSTIHWITRPGPFAIRHGECATVCETWHDDDALSRSIYGAINSTRVCEGIVVVSYSGPVLRHVPLLLQAVNSTCTTLHVTQVRETKGPVGFEFRGMSDRDAASQELLRTVALKTLLSGSHTDADRAIPATTLRPAMVKFDSRCSKSPTETQKTFRGVIESLLNDGLLNAVVIGAGSVGYYLTDKGLRQAGSAALGKVGSAHPENARSRFAARVDHFMAILVKNQISCPPRFREALLASISNVLGSRPKDQSPLPAEDLISEAAKAIPDESVGITSEKKRIGFLAGATRLLAKSRVLLDDGGSPISNVYVMPAIPVHRLKDNFVDRIIGQLILDILRDVGCLDTSDKEVLEFVLFGRDSMTLAERKTARTSIALAIHILEKEGYIIPDDSGKITLAGSPRIVEQIDAVART